MKGSVKMSEYIFIASDKSLRLLEVGLKIKNNRTFIENENNFLTIYNDEPNCYTNPFTTLPEIRHVLIGTDFSKVDIELFNYIKDAMLENKIVELWHTWMGETENIEKTTKNIDELTISDIRWVFEDASCTHPRGLKIFRWVRGKNRPPSQR